MYHHYLLFILSNFLYSYAIVEYCSVDEAKAVFDNPEDIVLDGRALYLDYTIYRQSNGKVMM